MTTKYELEDLLSELIEKEGLNRAKSSLQSLLQDIDKPTLTIISNFGNHKIPERYMRGEVYNATTGSLDFSNQSIIIKQYDDILEKLKLKLLERTWGKIYLVPTGHVTLSLQIKLLVYRITRMSTTDIFYSDSNFFELEIDLRKN